MKIIAILMSVLFVNTAFADMSVCGLGDVEKVATYNTTDATVSMMALTKAEWKNLENQFDNIYDCNEGVQLMGPTMMNVHGMQVPVMAAYCSVDSLGTNKVYLAMTCQEAATN